MSLRAGVVAMLAAGAAALQPDLSPHPPDSTSAALSALPAESPAMPSWTGDAEQDLPLAPGDLHAPMAVTHFTRQLDLVERDEERASHEQQLAARSGGSSAGVAAQPATDANSGAGAAAEPASSSSSFSSSSSSGSSSSSSSSSTSDAESSPLPSPFDDSPVSIFKSSSSTSDACPTFMKNLLSDATFKECYPLSMMLQTSTSFFQAEKQLVSIVRVLDATCAPDVNKCDEFLTQAAKKLIDGSNCKKEYDANQAQVTAAFNGLRAYKVLYSATCLQNPETQNYCFASAVTNVTNPSDIFFYSMPLGLALPASSTPSCGWCTSETMAIFHAATSDRSRKISSTYKDAARQVNTICGPGFVNDTATSGASRQASSPDATSTLVTALFATLVGLGTLAW